MVVMAWSTRVVSGVAPCSATHRREAVNRTAASTSFWIDQDAELTVLFFTQLLPSSAHRLRPQLRQLVYQALTD